MDCGVVVLARLVLAWVLTDSRFSRSFCCCGGVWLTFGGGEVYHVSIFFEHIDFFDGLDGLHIELL